MKYKSSLLIWLSITFIFVLTYLAGLGYFNLARYGALHTSIFKVGSYWRIITYGFLHSSISHFLNNLWLGLGVMLFLENKENSFVSFIVFISSVVFGGIGYVLLGSNPLAMTVGASAGVWGVVAALMVSILSKEKVNLIEFLLIFNISIVLFYNNVKGENINTISHYAGYIGGGLTMVILFLLKKEKKNEIENS